MTSAEQVERGHKALMTELFALCQPDKGNVFAFMDDHPELIRIILDAASLAPVSPQPVGEPDGWMWTYAGSRHVMLRGEVTDAKAYADGMDDRGKSRPFWFAHPDAEAEQRGRLAGIEEAAAKIEQLAKTRLSSRQRVYKYLMAAASHARSLAQPQEAGHE